MLSTHHSISKVNSMLRNFASTQKQFSLGIVQGILCRITSHTSSLLSLSLSAVAVNSWWVIASTHSTQCLLQHISQRTIVSLLTICFILLLMLLGILLLILSLSLILLTVLASTTNSTTYQRTGYDLLLMVLLPKPWLLLSLCQRLCLGNSRRVVNLLVQLGVLSFQVSQFTGEQLHFSSQLQFLFISSL